MPSGAKKIEEFADFKGEILRSKNFEEALACVIKTRENPDLSEFRTLAFQMARMFANNRDKSHIVHAASLLTGDAKIENDCWQRYLQFQRKDGPIKKAAYRLIRKAKTAITKKFPRFSWREKKT